ncbi:hypothetical protein HELRODRAFT_140484, partial [Helobdella robusta]|uniref:ADP-dependent glucokinase n=1 Tax=Helobdella robusta TaxID=6412 RepID=T1EJ12_HELRO
KVAVGFGSCIDVIVPALEVLRLLNVTAPKVSQHHHAIHDLQQFTDAFAYFFSHGAAAEHYVTDDKFFKSLVDAALETKSARQVVGGNAPVMLNNFKKLGFQVLLGAQMTEKLRKMIGDDILVAGSNVERDDIHLILEYGKGETWGNFESPRANRFIIHNDHNNPMLKSLEEFSVSLKTFKPHLVVVGGLQMLDNFPFKTGERRARLNELAKLLGELDADTHIHFEMAHFTDADCLKDILDTVAYHCDSFGMNEQELPNLLGLLEDDMLTPSSDPSPRIATTLDQMRLLFKLLKTRAFEIDEKILKHEKLDDSNKDDIEKAEESNSNDVDDGYKKQPLRKHKITRLHVHTLAFQVIMTENSSPWKNSMQAAARAALTANRHTCGSHQINLEASKILMDDSFSLTRRESGPRLQVDSSEPVTCWYEDDTDFKVCLAPVIVCTKVVQTVGGGDNISSSGLVLQI